MKRVAIRIIKFPIEVENVEVDFEVKEEGYLSKDTFLIVRMHPYLNTKRSLQKDSFEDCDFGIRFCLAFAICSLAFMTPPNIDQLPISPLALSP